MSMIKITVNDKEYKARSGQTILQACDELGIEIPTLCHDARLKPFGSCLLCRVEVEGGKGGTLLACGSEINEGMVIRTQTDEVMEARKMCLELLLSQHEGDCVAPCTLTCPANIDVQGYIAHIANGQYGEALKLIKERNPLPVVCGRICTRPCEDACRRNLVDKRVGIDYLKRFVADLDMESKHPYLPEKKPATGKKAAIIGAGPAGLSAAWYLAAAGHEVTVFERYPKAGGMLRYGIPAYRMPREALQKEVDIIESLGVEIRYNCTFGKDIDAESLKKDGYGAIFLAVGSQLGYGLDCEGEEGCPNVMTGVDFLSKVSLGTAPDFSGRRIAVVGGGNTAVDAARTSLRLGAKSVIMIYRRTRDEMPAHELEIEEAEYEGVELAFLANPKSLCVCPGGDGLAITLSKMALGEPDASGRRRPIEVPGSEYEMNVDFILPATGQTQDLSFINDKFKLETSRSRLIADEESMATNIEGVFAGGDVVTGPQTAIAAIAAGRRAAVAMDQYLLGKKFTAPVKNYNHTMGRELNQVDTTGFERFEKLPKQEMPLLSKAARYQSFAEVELGFSEEQARLEAKRCLSCGCKDVNECGLRSYATTYGAEQYRLSGEMKKHPIDESHPYISRDRNKCIMCGRCVRICLEVQGVGALGFMSRGYDTTVEPSFGRPFGEEPNCIRCGQCVSTCPVGALTEKVELAKPGPFTESLTDSICTYCGEGCSIELRCSGSKLIRTTSSVNKGMNKGNLCEKGRFANAFVCDSGRLASAGVREDGSYKTISLDAALELAAEKLKDAGSDSRFYISGRATNEEAAALAGLASKLGSDFVESFGIDSAVSSFYAKHPQLMVSGYEELDAADLFVGIDSDMEIKTSVAAVLVRRKIREGVKFIHSHSLTSEQAEAVKAAKAPVLLFGIHPDAEELEKAAELCEKTGAKMFVPSEKCNGRGVARYLSACQGSEQDRKGGTLLIFGEDPLGCGNESAKTLLAEAGFVICFDLFMTETARAADLVIPLGSFAENSGSFTSQFGPTQSFGPALKGIDNLESLSKLASILGAESTEPKTDCAACAFTGLTAYGADVLELNFAKKHQ